MKYTLTLFLLSFFVTRHADAAELPELFAKSEAGFADAEMKAQSVERVKDGSLTVTAAARADGQDVGFRVVLSPKWESWKPEGYPGTLYRGTVTMETTGKPTEAFVRALSKAYDKKLEKYEFTQVKLVAIALAGDPQDAQKTAVKLKLFFESEQEAEYAEIFLNLDLPQGVVQLHEKGPDYRQAVIGFLSRKKK